MAMNAENPSGGVRRVRRTPQKLSDDTAARTGSEPSAPAAPPRVIAAPSATIATRFASAGGIRPGDINNFLRQLIMLLEAGTPILKSLKTLSERGDKAGVRALVSDISQYVEMGNPLWQAFDRHPKYFDSVFVSLIKASEASGTLVPVLQRICKYRDRREILKKRVRGAMFYPVILVFACLAVVMFISMVVVPQFKEMFAKFQVKLPALTIWFMAVSDFLARYWWLGIIIIAALIVIYKILVRNPLTRLKADRIKLSLPIIGTITRKNAIVELTRTTALLLKSGLSMMTTLELVRNAIHNRAVANTLNAMRDSIERGGGLETPLRQASGIIPPVVADMLVTGEESGRLDAISEQIADTYEEEVNISIATLGEALQPILTIFLGVIVILLMLAVFQPLVTMINELSNASGGGGPSGV